MNSILSHSIPLKNVIENLAQELGTTVEKNCQEYSLRVPEKYGRGKIMGVNFQKGMEILLYNCYFYEDLEIRFIVDEIHPLKFLFCESGEVNHRFENGTKFHKLDVYENIIIASCRKNGHILQFKGKTQVKINSLEIDRKKFGVAMNCELKDLGPRMELLFRDIKAENSFFHHGNYSLHMADLFLDIENSSRKDFISRISLEGNAYKMLSLQLLQYNDDMVLPIHRSVLKKFEIKLILQASDIIKNEIRDFTTVQDLALLVGINTNKLQSGFKALYGTTVNEYIHKRRLDLAKNLLKNSEYSISEIVYLIGLTSKSYFSKIFKKKYGILPSRLRQKS